MEISGNSENLIEKQENEEHAIPVSYLKGWDLGIREGDSYKKTKTLIENDTDASVGRESFNEVKKRLVDDMKLVLQTAPNNSQLFVDSSMLKMIMEWDKLGRPETLTELTPQKYFSISTKPGQIYPIHNAASEKVEKKTRPNIVVGSILSDGNYDVRVIDEQYIIVEPNNTNNKQPFHQFQLEVIDNPIKNREFQKRKDAHLKRVSQLDERIEFCREMISLGSESAKDELKKIKGEKDRLKLDTQFISEKSKGETFWIAGSKLYGWKIVSQPENTTELTKEKNKRANEAQLDETEGSFYKNTEKPVSKTIYIVRNKNDSEGAKLYVPA